MSIKEQIKTKLRSIYHITDDFDVSVLLDDIQALTYQLQEPPAVRRAPDYPEPGQLFWQEVDGESTVCVVREGFDKGDLYWKVFGEDHSPRRELLQITEWLPVLPPKFEES